MKKQFLFLLISFQLVFAPAVSMAGEVDQKKADKAKKEGPVEQITAAAGATLAMQIPMSCPKLLSAPSAAVFFAGGLAYLGLEVASMVVLKKANKVAVVNTDNLTTDQDKSVESMKTNKKMFEGARKAAHLRIAGLSVLMAASYTAMGLAIAEKIEIETTGSNIFTKAASEALKQIYEDESCQKKDSDSKSTDSKSADNQNKAKAQTDSKGAEGKIGGDKLMSSMGDIGKGMATGALCMVLGFAGEGQGIFQGACAIFGLVMGAMGNKFYDFIKKPLNRAILFGVVGALDTAAVGITGDKIVKLNDYIKNLDTQIKDQEATIKLGPAVKLGATAGSSGGGNLSASVTPQAFTWNLPDDKNVIPKELRDIQVPTIQMPKGISSPTLTAAVSDIQNMARSVQKGQFSSANVSANNLINNAAKLRKLAQDLEKTYNEKLIASGQEPVNFTQEIEKHMKELQKDLNSAGAGMPSDLLAAASTQNKLDEKNNERKSSSGVETSKAVGMLDAKKGAPALIFSEEQAGGSEVDTLAMADEMTSENELKNFKVDNADIQKDSGPSIFDVLSVRYLKTAYPTLLKKLK